MELSKCSPYPSWMAGEWRNAAHQWDRRVLQNNAPTIAEIFGFGLTIGHGFQNQLFLDRLESASKHRAFRLIMPHELLRGFWPTHGSARSFYRVCGSAIHRHALERGLCHRFLTLWWTTELFGTPPSDKIPADNLQMNEVSWINGSEVIMVNLAYREISLWGNTIVFDGR